MQDQLTLEAAPGSSAQAAPARPADLGSLVVVQWTGREICALRMTNEEFAARLGVAAWTVAKWNTYPGHVTVPELQRALDTVLDIAPAPARQRFTLAPKAVSGRDTTARLSARADRFPVVAPGV